MEQGGVHLVAASPNFLWYQQMVSLDGRLNQDRVGTRGGPLLGVLPFLSLARDWSGGLQFGDFCSELLQFAGPLGWSDCCYSQSGHLCNSVSQFCQFFEGCSGRCCGWIFVIADVSKPILGADFLHHFSLMVDLQKGRLVDTNTHLQIQGIMAKASSLTPTFFPLAGASTTSSTYDKLLSEFPEVTTTHNYNDYPDQARCQTQDYHNGPTCVLQSQTTGTREAEDCQGRVPTHAGAGHHQTLLKQLVVTPPHGPQEDSRRLETLWGLQTT